MLTVYLVEDSPLLRERVVESIAEIDRVAVVGYAETEEAALAGIAATAPDAVILDIRLKRGNGLNVLRRLAHLGLADLPTVIVLTHYAEPEYRRRATEAGCDFFFEKSSELGRVGEVIGELARQASRAAD